MVEDPEVRGVLDHQVRLETVLMESLAQNGVFRMDQVAAADKAATVLERPAVREATVLCMAAQEVLEEMVVLGRVSAVAVHRASS